jgi:AraC family transcriptional regulator
MAENRTEALAAGSFYGAVSGKREVGGAIFTDVCHASARRLPAHSHQLPFFGMLLGGSYRENYVHRERDFGPFTMMFRPAGPPHQDEIGPDGVKFFEIEILPEWQKKIELTTALEDYGGGEMLWLALKLFRETRAPGDELMVESLLTELLGTVARQPNRSVDAPAWLGRIVEKLHDEFCEKLRLQEIAREAGMHPVHLSRVFRRFIGEGIGEYVHRLRVRAACEQMLRPEANLIDVALEKGFADQSHFTRVFHRVTGMSPGEFRRTVVSGSFA